MPNKILYLSNKRNVSTIAVSTFVNGGQTDQEKTRLREYTQPGAVIELRDRHDKTLHIGNYADTCRYLRKLNENQIRTFSDTAGFLDPNPPVGY